MNIQKIFLTFIITFFLLFFIISITYFDKDDNFQNFDIGDNYIGYNEIITSGSNLKLKQISKNNLITSKNYVDNINYIDRVYFSGKNYSKSQVGREIKFILGEGLYLFDLYDLSYNYSIKNEYFFINPKSPGKFFLDTRENKDIKIFSFDSIIDIKLISGGQTMTNLTIYPHMFYSMNSLRNKPLKNADILRIDSISKIFYINESFLDENKLLNKNFYSKLYSSQDELTLNFFENFFYLSYSDNEFKKYNDGIFKQYKSKDLLGTEYILKYFLFFQNDNKKRAFYKKNILLKMNDFFSNKTKYEELMPLKEDIISYLRELKKLDNNDYFKFRDIILFYYKNLLKINSIDYIDNTLVLSDIIVNMDNSKTKYKLSKSSFYLNKIYSLIDNKTYSNTYLQENLLTFLNYFIEENSLEVKNGNILTNKNEEIIFKLDYLSFFMKNILIYNITFSDKKNFDNILEIINLYLSMNNNLLNYYNNKSRNETLVVEYNTIIKKFLIEIKNSFFKEELTDRGLLILNNENVISNKQVVKFNIIMNTFFNFYKKNSSYLSSKNNIYNSIYEKNKNEYSIYYSAINNYSEYLIKYDKAKNDLLDSKTILETDKKIELNKEELILFLSQFEGLDYSNIKYKVFNNSFYNINNLYINGEKFSFDLYPYEFNRIENIYRNGNKLSMSYEMDYLKDELEELFKNAQEEEEKNKYDFRKFFLNTFFPKNENENGGKIFVIDEEVEVEDKTISFFKRDKLFGDKGEFNILGGFLDIKYEDVIVSLNSNNKYDIYIQKAILNTSINVDGEDKQIMADLKSNYVFSNEDHYFKNIKLKFFDMDYYERGETVMLFNGKEFTIDNIDILKIKDELQKEIEVIFKTN